MRVLNCQLVRQVVVLLRKSLHTKPEFVVGELKKKDKSSLNDLLISMPKEAVHIPLLKSARVARKEAAAKFPAGFIHLEVLGNGSKGAPPSLYVFTDQTRYLFNCGEGTQRLAHEYKMRLAKLEHVFVTSASWDNIGGLPGVALTIQDIGVPTITLHGPPGLEQLFEGTRRFVILKDLQIHVSDCSSDSKGFYEDQVMKIEYVPLHAKNWEETKEPVNVEDPDEFDDIDYYAPIKGSKRGIEIQGPIDSKKQKLLNSRPSVALSYICRPQKKAGALLIEKCLEFGVPAGPLLGKLKRGEDVTLADGKKVYAESVKSPDASSTVFLVVDCPSEQYIDSLIENEELNKFQGDQPVDSMVHVIVHFSPREVVTTPKYMDWMAKFMVSTKHVFLNELCTGMGSEAVHKAQFKLNLLDSAVFPPFDDTAANEDIKKNQAEKDALAHLPVIYGQTQFRYRLRPELGPDYSAQITAKGKEFEWNQELEQIPNFADSVQKLKTELEQLMVGEEFPKIVFLGTGSCIPNKTRNTSGILIRVTPSSSLMFDCGEGTFGQMARFFGSEVDRILMGLNGIYVSHLHADHHLGLISLLQRRKAAFELASEEFFPVYLIAPTQIQSWLHLYHRNFQELTPLYQLIPITSLCLLNNAIDPDIAASFYARTEINKMDTVPVRHCPNAYGVAINGGKGWKITYSGDTLPADSLVTLGKDSDLFIHEATMEDELKDEASLKMHSTVSEAISIGRRSGAKFTMLTHFSQRYAKVPKIEELSPNVGVAFDNMEVRLSDLPKVPLMFPLLKSMFAEHVEEMDVKTAKKLRRKARELRN